MPRSWPLPEWGETSLAGVGGVWSVIVALLAGIITLLLSVADRLPTLRITMDAGANASVLPALAVASLVGFGAVVAALPAFAAVADWVLTLGGGPLVSLAVAINILAALTGSASGGLTIALDALGETYMELAAELGIAPELLHRVAVISRRHARQPAAQWRGGDAAGGVRHEARRQLCRSRHHLDRRRDDRAGGGDRAGDDVRGVLDASPLAGGARWFALDVCVQSVKRRARTRSSHCRVTPSRKALTP